MNESLPFLFAADLDGTLLPNAGRQPAPGCLERTQELLYELRGPGCPVCFVTGRYLFLAKHGAGVFRLPLPDWWVCNVGTEIYDRQGSPDREWRERLGPALDRKALSRAAAGIPRLVPQETRKQGMHKFSFYYPEPATRDLAIEILERIDTVREDLQLVASVEEATGRALLDLIPAAAGKPRAVAYLAARHGLSPERTFFAGDSGNDLAVLLSGIRATLVGNAPEEFRERVRWLATEQGNDRLYFAEAYYGDGVIEGLRHFGLWPPDPFTCRH